MRFFKKLLKVLMALLVLVFCLLAGIAIGFNYGVTQYIFETIITTESDCRGITPQLNLPKEHSA
jgi:hypothetical protein